MKFGVKIKAVENEDYLFNDLKDLYRNENNIIFLGAGLSTNIAQRFSIYIKWNVKIF